MGKMQEQDEEKAIATKERSSRKGIKKSKEKVKYY